MISQKCLDFEVPLSSTDPLSMQSAFSKVLRSIEDLELSDLDETTDEDERVASASTLFLIQVCEEIPTGELPNPKTTFSVQKKRPGEKSWFDTKYGSVFQFYLKHHDNKLMYLIAAISVLSMFLLAYIQIAYSTTDIIALEDGIRHDHPLAIFIVVMLFFIAVALPVVISYVGRIIICRSAQTEIRNCVQKTFNVTGNKEALLKLKNAAKETLAKNDAETKANLLK